MNNPTNPQDNVPVKSVEYDKCPKTPIELLADIEVYKVLRSPEAAIKAIELHTEYCSAPLKNRITELEALNKELINAGQKLLGFAAHLRHEVDYLPDTYYEWMNKVIHETEELLSDDEPDTEQALNPKPLTDEKDSI